MRKIKNKNSNVGSVCIPFEEISLKLGHAVTTTIATTRSTRGKNFWCGSSDSKKNMPTLKISIFTFQQIHKNIPPYSNPCSQSDPPSGLSLVNCAVQNEGWAS